MLKLSDLIIPMTGENILHLKSLQSISADRQLVPLYSYSMRAVLATVGRVLGSKGDSDIFGTVPSLVPKSLGNNLL